MTLPYSRFSRRRSAGRVFGVAIALAVACFLCIAFCGKQIDDRRLEQLQIAQLNTATTTVLGDMDSFLLGERVESYKEDFHAMDSGIRELIVDSDPDAARSVLLAYQSFTKAIDVQREAIRARDNAAARRVDTDETDPAFDRLEAALAGLNHQMASEAERWNEIINLFIGVWLLVSAVVSASLLLRAQRKSESIIEMEVRQQSIETSERRHRSLVQNSSDVIVVVTTEGVVTLVSGACDRNWVRDAGEAVGRSLFAEMDPADAARVKRLLGEQALFDAFVPPFEVTMVDGQEVRRSFEVQMTNLLDDPHIGGVLLTFHDLTERKKYESELTYHAFHDRLTTLPNRSLFLDRLGHRLKSAEIDGQGFAVLFIDLDNFKIINDSLGHEAGDTLLIEVAARLQASVRPSDTVARMGGDEFTIILGETGQPEEAIEIAERIQRALVKPLPLGDREVFVTSSIGIVMTQDSGNDPASLLRDADTAMYQAKGNGKAALAVFEPGMNAQALDRLELEADLRAAIQEEQFYLVYQPIVDIATHRLREFEALIRWQHPTRGLVSPAAFIPLAEETGLICPIGRWALRQAFAQLSAWNEGLLGEERLRLSVNVSARQLQEAHFVNEVREALNEAGLDPSLVELEVTETAMLNDLMKMKGVFAQLRELGLQVAIDDFGTGYSSMAYLSQLPVDKLKIDRSFVNPLGNDERADGVVQAMITMARTLGLTITGEGIETEEQRNALQDMGCDLGQGFLFDRPMKACDADRLIARGGRDADDWDLRLAA